MNVNVHIHLHLTSITFHPVSFTFVYVIIPHWTLFKHEFSSILVQTNMPLVIKKNFFSFLFFYIGVLSSLTSTHTNAPSSWATSQDDERLIANPLFATVETQIHTLLSLHTMFPTSWAIIGAIENPSRHISFLSTKSPKLQITWFEREVWISDFHKNEYLHETGHLKFWCTNMNSWFSAAILQSMPSMLLYFHYPIRLIF